MHKELFTKHLEKRGANIIPSNEPIFDECMAMEFKSVKDFMKHIDFGCNISETGGCKEFPESFKCCCHSCYDNAGFFRVMVDRDVTKYAKLFSVKTGFWRQGTGCNLPHSLRSTICLTTHCNHGKHDRGFSNGIQALKDKIIHFRGKI